MTHVRRKLSKVTSRRQKNLSNQSGYQCVSNEYTEYTQYTLSSYFDLTSFFKCCVVYHELLLLAQNHFFRNEK